MKDTERSFDIYREGRSTLPIRTLIKMVLVVRKFRRQMDDGLRPIKQNSARMETLGALFNMRAPASQNELASRLRVESPTVTRMVDSLSKEGLVERTPCPNDRRVNLLNITKNGEQALEDIFGVYDLIRNHAIQDFSEEELAVLEKAFDKMLARMDEGVEIAMGKSAAD